MGKASLKKMGELVNTIQQLSLARDLKSVTDIVGRVSRKLTGADGATFVLRDGELCYYAEEDAISPLWKGNRFSMDDCISGWVMLNKKSVIIEDIYADSRIPVDAYRPTFVKSLAMVPIRRDDPIGAIGNYWAKHYQPSAEEMVLLQSLADITAVSIENIQVWNELNEKLVERSEMLKQLQKQKKQLEDFTHIIAHNMRSPLSNLLLLSDMMKESKDIEELLVYADKQKSVLDYLHQTFEELVDAMHVKMDFTVSKDHIVLEECLFRVTNLLQADITKSQAVLKYDFSEAKTAYFPKKYLDSIVFNLVNNAIKYRSTERKPCIHIKSYKKDSWTYLEVKDNGLGIDLKKHGDKMFMLRKTFHKHPEAKGFGLFITKTQVEAMGGEIKVNSIPGQGSIFTTRLFKNK